MRHALSVLLFAMTLAAAAAHAQQYTYTVLHNFCTVTGCTDGAQPDSALIQAPNGLLYGTTLTHGANGGGTIFKISTGGMLGTLYSFCNETDCDDGKQAGTLVRGASGALYGTTVAGGAYGAGTVFSFDAADGLTTLASFCSESPCTVDASKLIQATDKNFYGTTESGGAYGHGSVFKITPTGQLTRMYSFCSQPNCADGGDPVGGLVQASDGNLYGVTNGKFGTVFRISTTGSFANVYTFTGDGVIGGKPFGPLVQATDGDLYGANRLGGVENGTGTLFKISLAGALEVIYTFPNITNPYGTIPSGPLIQASDGYLYGTTQAPEYGVIYRVSLDGTTVGLMHSFCPKDNCSHGYGKVTLMQASDGNIYGTTSNGGSCPSTQCGTVFSLDVNHPFVGRKE